MMTKSRWVAGAVLATLTLVCQAQSTTIAVNPRATYLRTNQDFQALNALPIDLLGLGLNPGQRITLTRLGDFNCHSTCGDISTAMIAVFSSSNTLLAANQPHRVPGAIEAGTDVTTSLTFFGGVPTDIPQDFAIVNAGVSVTIPVGVRYLFVTAHDSLYGDNGDPDGDFAVRIELAPLANAGPDQSVSEGALVTLDGSKSGGTNVTFNWQQLAGPAVTLNDPTAAKPAFTAPTLPGGFGSQVLTFQLAVTSGGESSADTVDITVSNVNTAPEAHAGSPQTVKELSPVTMDGTASFDPDGDALTYAWAQTGGTPVEIAGANLAKPTFQAPQLAGGASGSEMLTFQLTVADGNCATCLFSSASVTITVEQENHAPTAQAGPDQTTNEGGNVTLSGMASSDPDGDSIRYMWSQVSGPAVVLANAATSSPSFTAPVTEAGGATLVFALVVDDGQLLSMADEVAVNVLNANDPPRCDLAAASPALLWPPNHKLVRVDIVGVTDPDSSDALSITVTGVTQDEPVSGLGDGDTSPDAVIQGNHVLLRAERAGMDDGRVYHVHFTATDHAVTGGSCTGTVTVGVPHSLKSGSAPLDGGQVHDSTRP